MLWARVALFAATATLAVSGIALASGPGHVAASCGNINQNTGGIQAHGVSCKTARKVAKAWDGEGSYVAYGFRCRYRDIGYEAGKISCRRGSARVIFYTGA